MRQPHPADWIPSIAMNDFDAEGAMENEWEESDLAWNEFDWERYLREQDRTILKYLACYEKLKGHPDRIDETAHLMGWDEEDWNLEEAAEGSEESSDGLEPYTLHKNPVFVATKAIFLGLRQAWTPLAADPGRTPQSLAVNFQTALHRGEEQATLAIQALDLGDYAMAISLFKRALRDLNACLALSSEGHADEHRAVAAFRQDATTRLFDLREIWLRVINECRDELKRHVDDGS